jgi:hypothetical protein
MADLKELAQQALAASRSGDVAPRVLFLRALAKHVVASPSFRVREKPPWAITPEIRILSDGTLSADSDNAIGDALALGAIGLSTLAARIAAFADGDKEATGAAKIVLERATLRMSSSPSLKPDGKD